MPCGACIKGFVNNAMINAAINSRIRTEELELRPIANGKSSYKRGEFTIEHMVTHIYFLSSIGNKIEESPTFVQSFWLPHTFISSVMTKLFSSIFPAYGTPS